MSEPAAPAPAKKKGKKKLVMIVAAGIVLVGGSIGAGVYAATSGMVGGKHGPAEDPNAPKLVPKGSGEHGGGEGGESHGGSEGSESHGSGGGGKYEATYYPIEAPFTANLRDSDSLVQLSLSVATFYDSKVTDAVKKDDAPIRSAVLETLSDQDPLAITTPAGKKALQAALTKAINATLREQEGFGGIDNVYFTSFIVQ